VSVVLLTRACTSFFLQFPLNTSVKTVMFLASVRSSLQASVEQDNSKVVDEI